MLQHIIIILQRLCRMGIQCPLFGPAAWKIARFLRRYFGSYRGLGPVQTVYDGSVRIWVSLSDHIESQIFWQGVQAADRGEVALLKSILRPDHVFFDVGANIGVFTLLAAKRLDRGCVHAFEPSGAHLTKLRDNLNLNRFQNVIVNAYGLSNASGQRTLFFPLNTTPLHNTGMASLFTGQLRDYTVEQVMVKRLDDYVMERAVSSVDVIKIDVEGSELDVLEGGVKTLAKYRPLVVMEVNKSHLAAAERSVEELLAFWKRMNYDLYRIDNNGALLAIQDVSNFLANQNIFCRPQDTD